MGVTQEPVAHRRTDGDGAASPVYGGGSNTDRLKRIQAALELIRQTLDVQFKRIAAMEAEVDLLRAQPPRR